MKSLRIKVSTHSRLKAAGISSVKCLSSLFVSTHSRLKAAGGNIEIMAFTHLVSTHSRLKAAGNQNRSAILFNYVSTHSRLKAAGIGRFRRSAGRRRFNTQPPKGGWGAPRQCAPCLSRFNTQPPKGGWKKIFWIANLILKFQHTAA